MTEIERVGMTQAQLEEAEDAIQRGRETFIEVGQALMAIRDSKGYRLSGYTTFEDYCQKRWGWSRSVGYDYIRSAEVAANVGTSLQNGSALPSHSQAVELAQLPPEEQREVAAEVDFEHTTVRELRSIVQIRRDPTPTPAAFTTAEAVGERISTAETLMRSEVTMTMQPTMDDGAVVASHVESQTIERPIRRFEGRMTPEPSEWPREPVAMDLAATGFDPSTLPPSRLSRAEYAYFAVPRLLQWINVSPGDVAEAAPFGRLHADTESWGWVIAWLQTVVLAMEEREKRPLKLVQESA